MINKKKIQMEGGCHTKIDNFVNCRKELNIKMWQKFEKYFNTFI